MSITLAEAQSYSELFFDYCARILSSKDSLLCSRTIDCGMRFLDGVVAPTAYILLVHGSAGATSGVDTVTETVTVCRSSAVRSLPESGWILTNGTTLEYPFASSAQQVPHSSIHSSREIMVTELVVTNTHTVSKVYQRTSTAQSKSSSVEAAADTKQPQEPSEEPISPALSVTTETIDVSGSVHLATTRSEQYARSSTTTSTSVYNAENDEGVPEYTFLPGAPPPPSSTTTLDSSSATFGLGSGIVTPETSSRPASVAEDPAWIFSSRSWSTSIGPSDYAGPALPSIAFSTVYSMSQTFQLPATSISTLPVETERPSSTVIDTSTSATNLMSLAETISDDQTSATDTAIFSDEPTSSKLSSLVLSATYTPSLQSSSQPAAVAPVPIFSPSSLIAESIRLSSNSGSLLSSQPTLSSASNPASLPASRPISSASTISSIFVNGLPPSEGTGQTVSTSSLLSSFRTLAASSFPGSVGSQIFGPTPSPQESFQTSTSSSADLTIEKPSDLESSAIATSYSGFLDTSSTAVPGTPSILASTTMLGGPTASTSLPETSSAESTIISTIGTTSSEGPAISSAETIPVIPSFSSSLLITASSDSSIAVEFPAVTGIPAPSTLFISATSTEESSTTAAVVTRLYISGGSVATTVIGGVTRQVVLDGEQTTTVSGGFTTTYTSGGITQTAIEVAPASVTAVAEAIIGACPDYNGRFRIVNGVETLIACGVVYNGTITSYSSRRRNVKRATPEDYDEQCKGMDSCVGYTNTQEQCVFYSEVFDQVEWPYPAISALRLRQAEEPILEAEQSSFASGWEPSIVSLSLPNEGSIIVSGPSSAISATQFPPREANTQTTAASQVSGPLSAGESASAISASTAAPEATLTPSLVPVSTVTEVRTVTATQTASTEVIAMVQSASSYTYTLTATETREASTLTTERIIVTTAEASTSYSTIYHTWTGETLISTYLSTIYSTVFVSVTLTGTTATETVPTTIREVSTQAGSTLISTERLTETLPTTIREISTQGGSTLISTERLTETVPTTVREVSTQGGSTIISTERLTETVPTTEREITTQPASTERYTSILVTTERFTDPASTVVIATTEVLTSTVISLITLPPQVSTYEVTYTTAVRETILVPTTERLTTTEVLISTERTTDRVTETESLISTERLISTARSTMREVSTLIQPTTIINVSTFVTTLPAETRVSTDGAKDRDVKSAKLLRAAS